MMQYDALKNPTPLPNPKRAQLALNQAQSYLDRHPYHEISPEVLDTVINLFKILKFLVILFQLLNM